jgi:branched-chain amino acid aminotransferase
MGIFFCFNGKLHKEETPVITHDNRSLKFGDGIFETIKMVKGEMILKEYHFERLFNGMRTLQFDVPAYFTPSYLEKEITSLAKKNKTFGTARVRLMVFRGDGSVNKLINHVPNYIIQIHTLQIVTELNTTGLTIDIYPDVKKAYDILSRFKTNNFLLYVMASLSAKQNGLDDSIVLNSGGRICDTSIANLFMIKDRKIFTPSLKEGCIAGIIRRWLIENIKYDGLSIKETSISIEEIKKADEVFLTNSINDIRWVKRFQNIQYANKVTKTIYASLARALYNS